MRYGIGAKQDKERTALLALADLLEYPGEDWPRRLELIGEPGDEALAEFSRQTESLPLAALQETYTLTFDLNPVASLEIGYHLFGENYKRGLFLAQLRETEAQYALDEQRQLPDYLPVLLRLLTRLDDLELREDLIAECLLPAIRKMKTALGSKENLYAPPLRQTAGRADAGRRQLVRHHLRRMQRRVRRAGACLRWTPGQTRRQSRTPAFPWRPVRGGAR
jgi:nitrate reductase molybdenum cofactor assembly chaperone